MPPIDYFTCEPFPIEWISNIQEKKDDINNSMMISQKKERYYKNSGHFSMDKSFDNSNSSSPEKKPKKNQKNAKNLKKNNEKEKNNKRPKTAFSGEIKIFGISQSKSKFSFGLENEIYPESTKSTNARNIISDPVFFIIFYLKSLIFFLLRWLEL